MRFKQFINLLLSLSIVPVGFTAVVAGQATGTLRGRVTLEEKATPLHNVIVTLVELKRSVETGDDGEYEFEQVPPGGYSVLVHMEGFPDVVQRVTVRAGETAASDFQLRVSGIKEQITVTATGNEQSTFEAFQAVTSLDSTRLAEESHTSLGEVLDKEPGVAKRSFGPGSSRPVIRGFDGDRVLVLQDGVRTGALGSQSGDHGEPIDVLSLERLEVVKGPATLLYGSNAVGGVVNAVTGHDYAHEGVRGYFTALAGTNNGQAGISAGLEYGTGHWMFWGNGSGQRTGDYDTPVGEIPNSKTRAGNGLFGLGRYGDRTFFSLSYGYDNRRYGVPFAGFFEGDEDAEIDLAMRRHDLRFTGGLRELDSFISAIRLTASYSDYRHKELDGEQTGTTFNNRQFVYRAVIDQRKSGRLTGSFGLSGINRDYEAVGAEALSPPVGQNAFAIYTLQEIDFDRVSFQLGGRIERNAYDPAGFGAGLRDRSFTGFSGAAGVRVPLWEGGAFVANFTHSYRAPALEELYNFGPHIGNLTFEIGNPDLKRERTDGLDIALRHRSNKVRAEANFFYYSIKDFVFLAPTGDIEDGLTEARYLQDDSRFMGTEINAEMEVHRNLVVLLGLDAVDAKLIEAEGQLAARTPLPRIPPLRATVGLEIRYRGLSLRPEAIIANEQDDLFPTETRTGGYTVFNLAASYSIPRQHFAHLFSMSAFNLGDRLYHNHLSFIKNIAPEIGRGVRFSYTLRFF